MNVLRISAISYINTVPFVYGIENSNYLTDYKLELDIPSVCADKLINDKVDIGLIPVAVLPLFKEYYLLTDFCIGADGPIRSVLLLSKVALPEIKEIYLDFESRTSVELAKILAARSWKIKPVWKNINAELTGDLSELESIVAIGDKTFELYDKFRYSYDLSYEWHKLTSLPFVFACWVANKRLPHEIIKNFNKAINFGVLNKFKAVESKNIFNFDIKKYIGEYINYQLDDRKREALNLFLKYIEKKH